MPTLMPPSAGARLGAVALTVLTAAGASWFAPTAAVAAPGDGADIRIHEERVPYGVSKDDPAVCRFYLDAANFGDVSLVSYSITAQPPLPTAATVSGTISSPAAPVTPTPWGWPTAGTRFSGPSHPSRRPTHCPSAPRKRSSPSTATASTTRNGASRAPTGRSRTTVVRAATRTAGRGAASTPGAAVSSTPCSRTTR